MKSILWLDDIRDPKDHINTDDVYWAKNFYEFCDYLETFGLPKKVFFDHDLGDDNHNGHDCAQVLCEWCLQNGWLPLPEWEIQSANPVGRKNIASTLNSYEKARQMSQN